MKLAGDVMSSEALFLTIEGAGAIESDRITALLGDELDSIMGKLAKEVAALNSVPLPAARNRFEAVAAAVSGSGCHLADAQRQKLAGASKRSRGGGHCRMRELPEPVRAQRRLRDRAGDQGGAPSDLAVCSDEAGRAPEQPSLWIAGAARARAKAFNSTPMKFLNPLPALTAFP